MNAFIRKAAALLLMSYLIVFFVGCQEQTEKKVANIPLEIRVSEAKYHVGEVVTVYGYSGLGMSSINTPKPKGENIGSIRIDKLPWQGWEEIREQPFTIILTGPEYDEFITTMRYDFWSPLSGGFETIFPSGDVIMATGKIRGSNGSYYTVINDFDKLKIRTEVLKPNSAYRKFSYQNVYVDAPYKETLEYKILAEKQIIIQIGFEQSKHQKIILAFQKIISSWDGVTSVELIFGSLSVEEYRLMFKKNPQSTGADGRVSHAIAIKVTVENQIYAEKVAEKLKGLDNIYELVSDKERDIQYHKRRF